MFANFGRNHNVKNIRKFRALEELKSRDDVLFMAYL